MSKNYDEDENYRIEYERGQQAEQVRYTRSLNNVQLSNMRVRQAHQFADSIGGCSSNYKF